MRRIWKSLEAYCGEDFTLLLEAVAAVPVFLLIGFEKAISGAFSNNWSGERINAFIAALFFIVGSLVPGVMILRKEVIFPTLKLKGKAAVIFGLIFFLIALFLGLSICIKYLL